MSDSGHFSTDWLPAGWSVEVRSNNGKNVKSYIDPRTGYRFYSKPKVLEYLRTQKNYSWRSQKEPAGISHDINLPQNLNETPGLLPHRQVTETPYWESGSQSGNIYEPAASEILRSSEMEVEKSPDWLPAGWTEEVKVKDGQVVKTYVDPLWGHRFYTKPQVLQYLGAVTNDSSTSQKETTSNNSESNLLGMISRSPEPLPRVSILTTPWENGSQSKLGASEISYSGKIVSEKPSDWLPTGWTEEVKIRNGRSIKNFVDPLTGRKFYSKPKVLEYLGTAKFEGATSEKKKIGNNFDINLPVDINDSHGEISELETRENGFQSGKSFKPIVDREDATPCPQLVESQNVETNNQTIHISPLKATSSRKRPVRKPRTANAIPSPQLEESQNVKTYNDTIHLSTPIETSSRKRPGRKPRMDTTEGATLPPQLVESQNVKTLDDTTHLSPSKETTSRNRRGQKPNMYKPGGGTSTLQPVESQNFKTLNHDGYASTSKETSSSKQPEKKIGVEQPEGLPPGWITEKKTKKTGNKTKKISYYIDPVSEYAFSSQKDAWRYYESGDISKCVIKPKKSEEMGFTIKRSSLLGMISRSPEPLPRVSILTTPWENGSQSKVGASEISYSGKIVSEKTSNSLPTGWTEEVKIRNGRSIKYYIDPVSEYVFSSQKDAWRYYEAGDISKCAIKPKKREAMGFTIKRSSPILDKIGSNTTSPQLEEPKQVNPRKRTRFSPEVEKTSSSKECDSETVIERVAAEGLPSGWIKEVKIEKFYTDPGSGYVFMSQKDALRYLETGDVSTCAVKPRSRDELGLNEVSTPKMKKAGGGPSLLHLEQSQNENAPRLTRLSSQQKGISSTKQSGEEVVERSTPIGLSQGSMRENNIQKKTTGTRRDSLKMDKTRGKTTLQQLEQAQNENTPNPASLSSPEKNVISFMHNGIETVLERVAPTGLPPGWIKEIRIQKKAEGIRKDTFYTDPSSGYVFSSQKDVIRYVKTGDIRVCAMRPKKREEFGFNQGNYNPGHDTTKEQVSRGKNVGSKRSFETMDSDFSPKRRQTRSSIASPAVVQKLQHDTTKNQLSTGKVGSKKSLETEVSDVSQTRRQTRSAAPPAVMQKVGGDTFEKQLSPGKNVGSKPSSEIIKYEVSEKRRQTRASAPSPIVVQKPGDGTAEKQTSTGGKKAGSKRSLETTDSDVSQKRRQTRLSASVVTTNTPIVELPKEVPKLGIVKQNPTKAKKGIGSKIKVKNVRSPPSAKNLKVKNVKKSATKKNSNKKTHSPAGKTKKKEIKKETRTPPTRVSKRILGSNIEKIPNSGSNEKNPAPKAKKIGKEKDSPCLDDPKKVTSGENSGVNKNIPCTKSPDDVANTTPEQLETITEIGDREVEKSCQNEDIPCSNASIDVLADVPEELGTVSEMGKTHDALGDAEALSNAEVSNKRNDAAKDQAEEQTLSQEQPSEMSNKSNEAMENQAEDQTISQEVPSEVSDKSNEVLENQAEDQTISQELPSEVSGKSNEVMENQAEDQTISQELPSEVPNKSKGVEDRTVSQEQPADVSNKSNEPIDDRTISLEQPDEVSNKSEAMEDQTVSQPPSEVLNKSDEAMRDQNVSQPSEVSSQRNEVMGDQLEDQIVSQEQPADVSNKSNEATRDQLEDQTISQEQPAEVSNKSKEAMEDQAEDQNISQDQQMYQFGEENTWSDPCLDFAFKTLTDTLPFGDNVTVPNIFQARGDDTSQVKTSDNGLTLLDFGAPRDRQVDNSHAQNGSEAVPQVDNSEVQNVSEVPTSATLLPDMNSSLPSGSETAPQQNEWEENENDDKNELTLDNYARFLF